MKSSIAVTLVGIVWLLLGSLYYPKWTKPGSEATISWDVSGYYHYLPAVFIYHDLKKQVWMNGINEKYLPSPAYDQSFVYGPEGNRVNKYAIGQAVLYMPFFLLAHGYASLTGSYPSDGYSRPYQIAIWLGSLCFAILGMVLLRRLLLLYFDEITSAWTLLTIGLATNLMEYASITNAMNHAWLFTLLCILLVATIRFYKKVDWKSACGIGVSLGLAVLTRPTEIIWALIPLLWGLSSLRERWSFLLLHWQKIVVAFLLCGGIMSIQSIYWKYVGNEWIIYTYGEQGFNWFHPAIKRGLLGANIGWLTYTPIMFVALAGWKGFYKKNKPLFWPVFLTSVLAIYITICWKHFTEGGGLGQRNLIQVYPLMAFPMATSIDWILKRNFGKWIWIGIFLVNVYYNGWWVHQAHKGGFFQAGQMNTNYLLHVAGRWHPKKDYLKLLDTHEYFDGVPSSTQTIFENNFDAEATAITIDSATGNKIIVLDGDHQFYGATPLPVTAACKQWIRLEADFTIQSHEWEFWKYTQWIVQFLDGENPVKTNMIRVQRLIHEDRVLTHVFFDVKIPAASFSSCVMTVWNAGSKNTMFMDNLKVSCFRP